VIEKPVFVVKPKAAGEPSEARERSDSMPHRFRSRSSQPSGNRKPGGQPQGERKKPDHKPAGAHPAFAPSVRADAPKGDAAGKRKRRFRPARARTAA
jgi:hypothetical protein